MSQHLLKNNYEKFQSLYSYKTRRYPSGWTLCFQWCLYDYENGETDKGFRFIWKTPQGKLQAARGQARIPDIETIHELTEIAKKEGWAYKGDEKTI